MNIVLGYDYDRRKKSYKLYKEIVVLNYNFHRIKNLSMESVVHNYD